MKYPSFFLMMFCSLSLFSQIPNPGFESWTSQGFPSYQNPVGWGNLNSSTWLGGIGVLTCERGSGVDAYSGSYSMKLTSKSVVGLGEAPGITVTGTINTNTQALEGGFPYTQRPTHLKGWFKYSPASGDNCEVTVTLWKRNAGVLEEIGEGTFTTTNTVSSFTRFMIPITYTGSNAPDSARILLVSTNTSAIKLGSVLIVDDLEFVDCTGFSVSVSATDASALGANDGAATANVTGGKSPYSYSWSNSETTAGINNLTAGSYCVTVTDDNGCTVSACAVVSDPSCAGFNVSVSANDATTVGGSNGSVTATPAGGTAPYSYLWDGGATTQTVTGLSADNYCVTVTDNAGCVDIECGTVGEPDCFGFGLSLTVVDASNANANDGSMSASAFGGAAPYTYLWSNNTTTNSITGLTKGAYCVTITDNVGCVITECDSVGGEPVGIFGIQSLNARLFPNPTTGMITIEVESHEPHLFSLFDLGGKLLLEKEVSARTTVISIAFVPTGTYLYSVKHPATGKNAFGKLFREE